MVTNTGQLLRGLNEINAAKERGESVVELEGELAALVEQHPEAMNSRDLPPVERARISWHRKQAREHGELP